MMQFYFEKEVILKVKI